jgi:hypothetical protein
MAFSLFAYPWNFLFLTLLVVRMTCQSVSLLCLKMHGDKMAPEIPIQKSMMDICDLCPIVCAHTISPIQKWWQGVLEIKVSCSQWEGLPCTLEGWNFCLLGEDRCKGARGYFFPLIPNVFPWGFQRVPQFFKLFPKMFPIAPQFYPL